MLVTIPGKSVRDRHCFRHTVMHGWFVPEPGNLISDSVVQIRVAGRAELDIPRMSVCVDLPTHRCTGAVQAADIHPIRQGYVAETARRLVRFIPVRYRRLFGRRRWRRRRWWRLVMHHRRWRRRRGRLLDHGRRRGRRRDNRGLGPHVVARRDRNGGRRRRGHGADRDGRRRLGMHHMADRRRAGRGRGGMCRTGGGGFTKC